MSRRAPCLVIYVTLASYMALVQPQKAEKCFQYRVDRYRESPVYQLLDNHETLLRIGPDYFDDRSVTKILSGDSCLLLIADKAEDEVPGCPKPISGHNTYTFGFRKRDKGVTVEWIGEQRTFFLEPLESIRVESNSTKSLGVVFDCHEECYEFENTVISTGNFSIFVRKTADGNPSCLVKTMTDSKDNKPQVLSGFRNELNKVSKADCWLQINITTLEYGFHLSEVYGSFQNVPSKSIFLGSLSKEGIYRFTLLDFLSCNGVRFSFCGVRSRSDSIPLCQDIAEDKKVCINMLYFYVTLPIWGILMIIIIVVTVTTCRLRLQGLTKENSGAPDTTHEAYDDVANYSKKDIVHSVHAHFQDSANRDEEEEEDHIYEEMPELFYTGGRVCINLQQN